MPAVLARIVDRLRNVLRGRGDAQAARVQRRRALLNLVNRVHPILRCVGDYYVLDQTHLTSLSVYLLVIGYLWLLVLPSQYLGRGVYIDENALQPAQVR